MSYRICLVCMGNICRSPMAEVVLRKILDDHGLGDRVTVDSAGTGDWHRGSPMDARAAEILADHGYDGSRHRARQFLRDWYGRVDLVLAMDTDNLRALRRLAPDGADVRLFRSFDPAAPEGSEVPDPYYGEQEGFAEVLEMVEAASEGLAKYLVATLR
ncbi:low molecular weight phosphotyrosine protein phosphatase [Streptosporangium sp. NBC_01755]|uniref:low molecular weight protein-tyrosine-phosphatase n=1 Tax=Streptosporangium sp. NBC_01755 TaxID=2975949 RepID=UPI002DDA4246|nr:low molecular weight protein-tyrosine-phosphatase [Streptosporangium sp. NBC_01755]WSD00049.1 low molecular weight phosphotyrosine protein phosphatase [Streptosporangium sp. NBC_01755]